MSDFRAVDHPDFIAAITTAVMGRQGKQARDEITFTCLNSAHPDKHPSASWNPAKGLWSCHVCHYEKETGGGGALHLAKLLGVEKPRSGRGGGGSSSSRKPFEHSHTSPPDCTLAAYAEVKQLPEPFLRSVGLSQITYESAPAVSIPYHHPDGTIGPIQYRVRLTKGEHGEDRFKWKRGSKAMLYGLHRLDVARERGHVAIVEGASDCHTLWYHGEPAIGLPGAGNWRDDRDAAHLDGIGVIFVVIEHDSGGEAVQKWLATSSVRDRVRIVDLGSHKDPSALYLDDPERFQARWQAAKDAAIPWTEMAAQAASAEAEEAFALCHHLLAEPNILDSVQIVMRARGYAGDLTSPKLGYVALTSRLLDRPLNLAFVAQSGAGKNRVLDAGVELMPVEAYYVVKAASSRTLIYNEEAFEHRVVIFGEADSIPEDGPAASAIRNLAADNVMEYEVVERDEQTGKWGTRKISKPGPTGLMTTSTRSLREQMGTRLLEVSLSDDATQTYNIMRAHAATVMPRAADAIDLEPFHALQRWLTLAGEHRVAVPYADTLAKLLPSNAVRMRRDFRQLLTCIQAVALLHQTQRRRTPEGWIVAEITDYAIAHELLSAVFDTVAAEGVTPAIRATVEAVTDDEEVSEAELMARLNLAKSTVSWRVRRAVKGGWLVNNENRRGAASKLARGAPLPEEASALPSPEALRKAFECSSASGEGEDPPPPAHGEPDIDEDTHVPPESGDLSTDTGVSAADPTPHTCIESGCAHPCTPPNRYYCDDHLRIKESPEAPAEDECCPNCGELVSEPWSYLDCEGHHTGAHQEAAD